MSHHYKDMKILHVSFTQIKDEQYAKLVQQLDSEEQLSSALTAAEKNARMLETQRVRQFIRYWMTYY